jgi:hypothetical protein
MDESRLGGEGPAGPQPVPAASGMPEAARAPESPDRAPAPESAGPAPESAGPAPESAGPVPAPRGGRDDWGFDTSFSPTASAELESYRTTGQSATICMWCNNPLPSRDATKCPTCGALLEPPEGAADVPGLTSLPGRGASRQAAAPTAMSSGVPSSSGLVAPRSQVPSVPAPAQPDASLYDGLTPEEMALLAHSSIALREEISKLGSHDALKPPSRDVRQAMLEIEFEADRADPLRIVDPGPLAERRHRDVEPPV